MPHACIIGMTESGKTTLGQALAASFRRHGVGTLVLHKEDEPWPRHCVSYQTDDPERFLNAFLRVRQCAAFAEIGDADVSKWDERFHKLATKGRHLGNRVHFMMQDPTMTHPRVRRNIVGLYLFRCSPEAAAIWAKEFADRDIMKAAEIGQYEFVHKASRFTPATVRKLPAPK